jgi:hypothetical protein
MVGVVGCCHGRERGKESETERERERGRTSWKEETGVFFLSFDRTLLYRRKNGWSEQEEGEEGGYRIKDDDDNRQKRGGKRLGISRHVGDEASGRVSLSFSFSLSLSLTTELMKAGKRREGGYLRKCQLMYGTDKTTFGLP